MELFDPLLRFLPLGNVPCDLSVADNFFGISANGIDDDMRPKARAVLTNAPAFSFRSSLVLDCGKRLLRLVCCTVFVCVEPREVMPDYFVWKLPLNLLCAEIPIGHAAVRVQQEDGVIGDALHE